MYIGDVVYTWVAPSPIPVLTTTRSDLHRPALPAADAPRLPPYVLRRMSQGMVRLPSIHGDVYPPVHVPVVSCLGTDDAAKRLRHHSPRQLCEGKPGPGQERRGEGG